jgi:uncharacterized protein YhaN
MRIERLSLDAFGHFTGTALDFGRGDQVSDFHVVHGPNEAGKTTLMEGYLRLIYGFQHREPYAFLHQRPNLRVSGLLQIGGASQAVTRLPSRKGNLRGAQDAILPESAIASHLGGLALEDYRRLLCLDDETIETGGEDIANAKGDIGRLLFSAAAGVANLNAVLEAERTKASELYRRRASTTRVAELKRELADVEEEIRQVDVSAHAWRKLKDALRTATQEETAAREARDALRAEQTRTAAMRRAIPKLGELDRLAAEIADCADYPERIDVNPEHLVEMTTERGRTEAELARVTAELQELARERETIVVDPDHLDLGPKLDDLDELRSRMQTAARDIPRRETMRREAEADMRRAARELGAPDDCDLAALVVSSRDIDELEDLRERMRTAIEARQAGLRAIEDHEARIAKAKKAHQDLLDNPPARTGLVDLLKRFDADVLAADFSTATQAIASAEEALQEAVDELSTGGRTFGDIPDCPVDAATAASLAGDHAGAVEAITRADDRLAGLDEEVAAIKAKIASLRAESRIVGDDEARAAVERRDRLWADHRAALTSGSADRFEAAMQEVDALGAARLAHASDLGELRTLTRDLAETEARAAATRERRGTLAGQVRGIEEEVTGLCTRIGLPPLSPEAFSEWVARHGRAAGEKRRRDGIAERHQGVLARAARLLEELTPIVALETPTFDAAIRAARQLAEDERTYLTDLRAAADRISELQEDLAELERERTTRDTRAGQTREDWVSRVNELFAGVLSADTVAGAPGRLRDIREHDLTRRQAARQVSTMQADQHQFTTGITALGDATGIRDDDPLELFRQLRDLAGQAEKRMERRRELDRKLQHGDRARTELTTKLRDLDRKVADLGAVFPRSVETGTLEALRKAVGTGIDVIATRGRIAELEQAVLDDISVRTIAEARHLLADKTISVLEARERSLEADLEHAEACLSSRTTARANAERDLAGVTGDTAAAELVERRNTLQMQIEETLIDYLERDIGLRLADEAIRRYRDEHRSGMMTATERAFAELTNGAYEKLVTQPDGASEVLLAIDAAGTTKQIGDLSKGTRFQLYLALRAAAYEQMVAQGVQLPFFCDDVFETFDEERTRAACRLMERIGRHGQAVYLTHHRHVVEIAREVCAAPPVIHEL